MFLMDYVHQQSIGDLMDRVSCHIWPGGAGCHQLPGRVRHIPTCSPSSKQSELFRTLRSAVLAGRLPRYRTFAECR